MAYESKEMKTLNVDVRNYRMPESFSAFCSIVSLTAANTRRMFVVSVACVKLCKSDRVVILLKKERAQPRTEDIR